MNAHDKHPPDRSIAHRKLLIWLCALFAAQAAFALILRTLPQARLEIWETLLGALIVCAILAPVLWRLASRTSADPVTSKEPWTLKPPRRKAGEPAPEEAAISEAQLRLTQFSVDRAADAVFWIKPNAQFVFVNDAVCRSLGYTREELLTMTVHDIDPDFTAEVWPGHWEELKRRGSFIIESRHRTKDGKTFPVEIAINYVEVDGKPYNCAFARDITERKQAEAALLESERMFRLTFENAKDAIFWADIETGTIINCNRAAETLLEKKREKIVGEHQTKLHPPDRTKYFDQLFRKHIREGGAADIDSEIITRSGKIKPVRLTASIIQLGERSIIQGIFHDISDQKEAERAIKEQAEKLEVLNRIIVSGSRHRDLPSLLQDVLGSTLESMNFDGGGIYLVDEAAGVAQLQCTKALPSGFIDEVRQVRIHEKPYETIFVKGQPIFAGDYAAIHPKRSKRWDIQSMALIPLFAKDKVIGALNVGSKSRCDFSSERRELLETIGREMGNVIATIQAEQALHERENFLKNVFDAIQDGISVLDRDLSIIRVNSWMEKMYADEMPLVGKKCYKAYQKRETVCPWCPSLKTIETGEKHTEIVPYPSVDNPSGWIELSSFPLKDAHGNVVEVIEYVKNITERKRAEDEKDQMQAQLLQAQKMEAVGRLAGGVAHDFNNLLTVIKGYTELSMIDMDEKNPLYKELKRIHDATRQAASLTRQLLLFSRKQPMELVTLNINRLVNDLLKMLNRLIGEDIIIRTDLELDLWTVRADKGNIEQVIMNLAVNARDAMPNGGVLKIKTENKHLGEEQCKSIPEAQPGRFIRLTVEDTGSGIDEETIQRIFDPFFSTKEAWKGTGLGLTVVYGILKQHGGWIHTSSEPGRGSTFEVYLPAFSGVPEESHRESATLEEMQGNGERILVVEDEKEVRELAAIILVENGYLAFQAESAAEALAIFERENGGFELIFSDVVLPDKSGLQLVDELLARRSGLSVLLGSGYVDERSRLSDINERGIPFVQKPYSVIELLRVVKEALRHDSP